MFYAMAFENRSNSSFESSSRQMNDVPVPVTLSYVTPAFLDTIGMPFKKESRSVKINVNLFLLHTVVVVSSRTIWKKYDQVATLELGIVSIIATSWKTS